MIYPLKEIYPDSGELCLSTHVLIFVVPALPDLPSLYPLGERPARMLVSGWVLSFNCLMFWDPLVPSSFPKETPMEKGSRCPFAGPYALFWESAPAGMRAYHPSWPARARPWCAEVACFAGSADDERIVRFLELAGLVSGRLT